VSAARRPRGDRVPGGARTTAVLCRPVPRPPRPDGGGRIWCLTSGNALGCPLAAEPSVGQARVSAGMGATRAVMRSTHADGRAVSSLRATAVSRGSPIRGAERLGSNPPPRAGVELPRRQRRGRLLISRRSSAPRGQSCAQRGLLHPQEVVDEAHARPPRREDRPPSWRPQMPPGRLRRDHTGAGARHTYVARRQASAAPRGSGRPRAWRPSMPAAGRGRGSRRVTERARVAHRPGRRAFGSGCPHRHVARTDSARSRPEPTPCRPVARDVSREPRAEQGRLAERVGRAAGLPSGCRVDDDLAHRQRARWQRAGR
jgi:hypothetical protein